MTLSEQTVMQWDRQHIWHPYASIDIEAPLYSVVNAQGCYLFLHNGQRLLDGMASWWSAIHGYNHPVLNQAVTQQLSAMSHVMFGGLTHEPAARLAKKLVELTPAGLERVFFADSGSVAMEVAMKMALQYWRSERRPGKTRFVSLNKGYHGDTFGAMSLCDPVTGMHHLFADILARQFFIPSPSCDHDKPFDPECLGPLQHTLAEHHEEIAALVVEPVVQGTGGMRFYSPEFLTGARQLCDRYGVLLIADEIATGFGRTGTLFACEQAEISPDILALGKALTGGYLTLAATLCSAQVAQGIASGEAGVLMHGPTFMANPLACATANASIDLLLSADWQSRVMGLQSQLLDGLAECREIAGVKDVRALGAIGVVELDQPVDMKTIVPLFVDAGVWVRPFGALVYVMPPFIMSAAQARELTAAITAVLKTYLRQ